MRNSASRCLFIDISTMSLRIHTKKKLSYPHSVAVFFFVHICSLVVHIHSLTLRVYVRSVHSSLSSRAPFAALPATDTGGVFVVSYCAASSRAPSYINLRSFCTPPLRCHISRLQMSPTQSLILVPHSESPTVATPLTHLATTLEPSAPTESLTLASSFTTFGTPLVAPSVVGCPPIAPKVLRRPPYCNPTRVPHVINRFPLTCLHHRLYILSPHSVRHLVDHNIV